MRLYPAQTYSSGWSFNVPTQDLVDAFDSADKRKNASVLDIVSWSDANAAQYNEGYEHTGYFNNKYIPRAGYSKNTTELNYENNYRYIRYADVLLMAAEANNRGGISDSKAQTYLNQVRSRAGVSSVSDNSTGNYTVNWSSNFPNVNYTVTVSHSAQPHNNSTHGVLYTNGYAVNYVNVVNFADNSGGNLVDKNVVCVVARTTHT